jgi:hypothetical protein
MPAGGWKIDTLDARGGFAFASRRDRNLAAITDEDPEAPCRFIGAPDFRPEPVANYALALGAGRGAFQTGLFVGDDEVSFPTIEDVVEFVRRAYLRGGGGDGADGGAGGTTPPLRPVEGPISGLSLDTKEIDTDVRGRSLRAELLNAIGVFNKEAESLKLHHTARFDDKWPAPSPAEGGVATTALDGPSMLASAALQLIYEMVRRLPRAHESVAVARWVRDARMLGDLLASLDLWPLLWSDPYYNALEKLGRHLLKSFSGSKAGLHRYPKELSARLAFITTFVAGPPPDDLDEAHQWFDRHWHDRWSTRHWHDLWSTERADSDPISNLSRIPLPEDLEGSFFEKDLKGRVSMSHVLAAFVGAPAEFDGTKPIVELALFAAACIVGPDNGWPVFSWSNPMWDWKRPPEPSQILRAAVQANADCAWRWLREHLPVVVFHSAVEKAIAATARLRYETGKVSHVLGH